MVFSPVVFEHPQYAVILKESLCFSFTKQILSPFNNFLYVFPIVLIGTAALHNNLLVELNFFTFWSFFIFLVSLISLTNSSKILLFDKSFDLLILK